MPALLPRPTVRPRATRPAVMAGALALLAYGANMGSPLFPAYQERLGFDDLTLTLVYAVYAAVSVPALLVLGPLGDRIGRVRLVRIGLLLGAVGSLLFAVADHPAWMFAGRAAQGIALGAATGAGMAVLADTPSRSRRGILAAGGALAFLAGTAAGPGISGALAAVVPAPLPTVHLLHAAAVAAVFLALGRGPRPVPSAGRTSSVRPQLPDRDRPSFRAATAAGFVSWSVVGLFLGLVPSVLVRDVPGVGVATLGGVVSMVLVASLPMQLLLPRLGAARAQASGLALLGAGLAVLATTGEGTPVGVVLGAALVAGCGHGLAYGGAHATVQALGVGPRAAGITATAYVVQFAGAGLPAVVVGLLSRTFPLETATALIAAVLLLAAACAAALVRGAAGTARPADGPLADLADLVRGMLHGIHDANGIWHGRRPGRASAAEARTVRPGRAAR